MLIKQLTALLNLNTHDLVFIRYRDGIKVCPPEKKHVKHVSDSYFAKHGLSQLMKQPFNLYFNDHESRMLIYNDETAKNMQFYSLSDGIGKTMFDISPTENAYNMIKTDQEVIGSQAQKIVDDVVLFKENPDLMQSYLSIKMPFYDHTDHLCGLFGCSVNLNQHSPASFLSFILESGLARLHPKSSVNLTKMQQACASLLLKGRTAKAIGGELNVSARTVETHINHMKDKLACRNKTELILKLHSL